MDGLISSFSGMFSNLSTTLNNSVSETMNIQDDFLPLDAFYQAYVECKSAHEIAVFVSNHVKYLKWLFSSARLTAAQECVALQHCLICKSHGFHVSFAVIHAIQLAQSSQEWRHKHIAYLTCCELMDEHSDMAILMVATLQQDLRSRHVPTICLALSTAAAIVSSDLIPSIDYLVCEKLNHLTPMVRQKAVICLGIFVRRNEELLQNKLPYFRAMLKDKDPSVMRASLEVLSTLSAEHIMKTSAIFKPLCFILDQFLNAHVPRKFMNKNVCGPHVVVKLVKVLRKLDYDKDDQKQKLTLLMLAAMDKYDSIQNIPAVMVMKECCTLLLSISSDAKHHTRVANVAQQLLISSVPNFQYVALEIFSELIKKDKLQISRHQGLIVQALASADSVIADKSVFLIIKLANAENVQSVYELYAKVCKANEGASKAMRFGGHILTSCALRDVETAWFTSKLLELLSNDQGSESHSEDSLLKVVLRYISAEDSTESAVDLYQCLDRLVTQEETSCLDVFTIMLWLIHVHKTAFSERDSHIFSLIRSSCRRAKRPCNNILTFLSTVRALLVTSAVSIEDDDVRALKKLSTSSSNEAACYIYLQDIEHIMTSSFRPKLYESKDLREVCRNDLEQYMKRKIQAKQCRADPSMSLGKEKAPIQFQPESDTRVTSSSHEGTLLLGKSKHVWTAAGRVESNGDEVDEQSKSVDEAAPAELTVKPDDTSTETLANHIFSSLKHKD